jgi:hypothetical protein
MRPAEGPEAPSPSSSDAVDTGEDYLTNVEFQVMTADDTPLGTNTEQTSDVPLNAPSIEMKAELLPTAALAVGKSLLNGVWHDCGMTEVVACITARARPTGAQDYQFFFAPPDNGRRYESIILPPHNYPQAIRYLDEVHGLYEGNPQVFLDADAGYVMSSAKQIDPAEGDPAHVSVEVAPAGHGGPDYVSGSGYDDASLTYRLRTATQPSVDMGGPVTKELAGEQVKLVGTSHRELSESDARELTPDGVTLADAPKSRVAWQTYDNPLTGAKLAVQAREQYSPMTMHFESPDIHAFDPTLPWAVVAGDDRQQQIQGSWRLKAFEAVMTRQAGGFQQTASLRVAAVLTPSSAGAPPSQGA